MKRAVGAESAARGRVLAVSVSDRKGTRKTNVASARLIENLGIEGDAHAGPGGGRQVSLLAWESIAKMRAKGLEVDAGAFAENITTQGIEVAELPIGARLRIGGAELEITQIGKECHGRCAIYYQAGDCIMPREGVFAKVLRGGEIRAGDAIREIAASKEGPRSAQGRSGVHASACLIDEDNLKVELRTSKRRRQPEGCTLNERLNLRRGAMGRMALKRECCEQGSCPTGADQAADAIRTKLDPVFEKYEGRRRELIPILQDAQEALGYLPPEAIAAVARFLGVTESTVYGVATFYAQFYLTRQGKHRIRVCRGTACHVRGSKGIMETIVKKLGIQPGQTTPDYQFSLERVACFGSCALGPVVVIDNKVHGRMTSQKVEKLLERLQ